MKSKGSICGTRVSKRETECLFGKPNIFLLRKVKYICEKQRICVGGRSSYMWEAENFKGSRGSLFLEAEDLWDAEDLCEKQCIFVESRVSH